MPVLFLKLQLIHSLANSHIDSVKVATLHYVLRNDCKCFIEFMDLTKPGFHIELEKSSEILI